MSSNFSPESHITFNAKSTRMCSRRALWQALFCQVLCSRIKAEIVKKRSLFEGLKIYRWEIFHSNCTPVPLKKNAAAGAGPNKRRPARGGPVATAPLRGARYPGSFGGRAAGGWRWAVASRPLGAETVPLSGDRRVVGPLSGASGWSLPVTAGRVLAMLSSASCGPSSPLSSPGCPRSGPAAPFRAFSGDPLILFWATRTLWLPTPSPALFWSELS